MALERHQPTCRRWRHWTEQEPPLAGLSWSGFRSELRRGSPVRQDELLAAVVRIAQHDTEATAVVVACLVPGLRARIARHAPGLDRDDAWSIAVAGICEAVTGHELPGRFVASGLLDAAKRHLQRAVAVEATWATHARRLPDVASNDRPDEPSAELILTTAVAAGVLSRPDAWLLHATLVVGHSLPWAARRLGISYEGAKKRRQRAEAGWKSWWACGIGLLPGAYRSVGNRARGPMAVGEVAG